MTVKKKSKLDLADVPADKRARVERILYPRDTILSLRFRRVDIEVWKRAADAADMTLTAWIETKLNG